MMINYVRTAWRHLIRQKGYTFLNVFGLAVHTAASTTKEIGIREVLGATTRQIYGMLTMA